MTPEITEEQLIDYLYGELDDDQRKTVEAYLDAHPEKREELDALERTRGLLAEWEDEDPGSEIVFVTERNKVISRPMWRVAAGIAIAAAAVLVVMFADFEIGVRDGRFHFSAGGRVAASDSLQEKGSDRVLTVGEYAALQNEYFELTRQLIETSELRQQQAMMQLSDKIATQRAQDLQLVGQGIRDVARTTNYSIEQTDMLIDHVQAFYRKP